jgi:drug/metabolite transporter (DMT)-like permease
MTESELRMGPREWALLVALSVLWGGSFFFFKVLVAEVPPFTVVLGRVGLAAVILNLVIALRGERMPGSLRLWGSFLVMGLLNNVVPFTLIVFGETRISGGLASILNATTPLFTVVAAHFLTANEKLSPGKVAGVMFGFLGVAVLIGPSALMSIGQIDLTGQAACLLAALMYALAGIYGRRFRGLPPMQIATGQISASTMFLIPVAMLIEHPWTLPTLSTNVWLAWIGIAVFSTSLAYILYFKLLAAAGATNLLLVTFLLPVSALLLGVTFLNEAITSQAIIGMIIIGCGLASIDGRLWRFVGSRRNMRWEKIHNPPNDYQI